MNDPEEAFRAALSSESAVTTPHFAARKARLREDLTLAMVTHHRTKRARRAALVVAATLCALWAWPRRPVAETQHAPTTTSDLGVERVRGLASPRAAWSARPGEAIVVERISDEQALEWLARSEHPGGLFRIADRMHFVSHDAQIMD